MMCTHPSRSLRPVATIAVDGALKGVVCECSSCHGTIRLRVTDDTQIEQVNVIPAFRVDLHRIPAIPGSALELPPAGGPRGPLMPDTIDHDASHLASDPEPSRNVNYEPAEAQ